jgi:hypothetical protein
VAGPERDPFSIVRTIEELLGRKVVADFYKIEINGSGEQLL